MKKCTKDDTACIKKAQCETCRCGAINIAGSERYKKPWALDDYKRACPEYVEGLENTYRTHMGR
jgi:hypothetical protein